MISSRNFFVNHTNRLIQIAKNISIENSLGCFPYPKKPFKSDKEYQTFIKGLTNFIDKPELFYLSKGKINTTNQFVKLRKSDFQFI